MSSSSSRRARWKGTRRRAPFEPERFALQGTPGVWPDDASTRRSRTRVPGGTETKRTLRQTCPRLQTEGAICVQRLDDSRNSAIHTTYRSLLRSSSTHEPRGPPLEVVSLLRCLLDNKDQPKPMRSTSSSTKKVLRTAALPRVGEAGGGISRAVSRLPRTRGRPLQKRGKGGPRPGAQRIKGRDFPDL